jgi:hypothetical protein
MLICTGMRAVTNKLRRFQSAGEPYRLFDRRWSANFSANFCRWRGVTWSARRVFAVINLGFLDRSRLLSLKYFLSYPHEVEWTPFRPTITQKI